jgi:serine/threonine protein kinase
VADESSDIYSLGMVISEILTGSVPYDELPLRRMSLEDFFIHVYDGRHRPNLAQAGIPQGVIDAVGRTWFTESQLRCSAMDLLRSFLDFFDDADRRVAFRRSIQTMESPPASPALEPQQGSYDV